MCSASTRTSDRPRSNRSSDQPVVGGARWRTACCPRPERSHVSRRLHDQSDSPSLDELWTPGQGFPMTRDMCPQCAETTHCRPLETVLVSYVFSRFLRNASIYRVAHRAHHLPINSALPASVHEVTTVRLTTAAKQSDSRQSHQLLTPSCPGSRPGVAPGTQPGTLEVDLSPRIAEPNLCGLYRTAAHVAHPRSMRIESSTAANSARSAADGPGNSVVLIATTVPSMSRTHKVSISPAS